jgi:hypothetical protein
LEGGRWARFVLGHDEDLVRSLSCACPGLRRCFG